MAHDDEGFVGCVKESFRSGLGGALVGTFGGCIVSAWNDPYGTAGKMTPAVRPFRLIGRYATIMSAVGFIYSGAYCAFKNIRKSDDMMNGILAGCSTGIYLGLHDRSLRRGVAVAAAMAVVSITVDFFDHRASPPVDRQKFFPYLSEAKTNNAKDEH